MRTIWVAIRGVNYTDRATREVGRNIDVLVKAQQDLRQQAVMMLSAGIMWMAFAGLAGMAITKVIGASAEGRRAMNSLGRATNELMKGLSESFLQVLGPSIQMLTAFFQLVAKNEGLLRLITVLATLGVTMAIVKGASMLLGSAINFAAMQALGFQAAGNTLAAGAMVNLYTGLLKLQAVLGPILLGFMIGVQLASMFGKNAGLVAVAIGVLTVAFAVLAAILWSNAAALSVLTFGLAATAGAAALAIAQQSMPQYQTGVDYVRRTRPAIVHEGEKIIPARDRGMTGTAEGSQSPQTRKTEINFYGDLHTKADKETLRPFVLKVVRDAMDNRV